jgi:hypothetical protein
MTSAQEALAKEYQDLPAARRRNWVALKLMSAHPSDRDNVRRLISKGVIAAEDAPSNKRMDPVSTK